MRGSEIFLDKPAAELEEYLLQIARTDAAPTAARERALRSVASAALGVGALSGATAALGSRGSLFKGTSWLVAKWLAVGATTGFAGLGAAQGIQELAAKGAARPASPYTAATHANIPAQLAPSESPPPLEASPVPETAIEPVPSLSVQAAAPVSAPLAVAAAAHEPKSAPQVSSDAAVGAPPLTARRSSLTRELSLLEQARGALTQHSASSALQMLDDYRAEFPHGSMLVEAAALRVEAVGQSGDRVLAQRLAQTFLNTFPTSPLAARVQTISEVSAGEQKP